MSIAFIFLNIKNQDSLMVGELLLNATYTHCIFENPGVGYFCQCLGWAMGTNAAPMWSASVLRYYERMILPLYPSLKLLRFIDDGLLFHPKFLTPSIDLILRTMYRPNLSFDVLQKGVTSHISFLDVFMVTLHPLRHSVFWRPTHSALYIPWHSKIPRNVKEGWVVGCIRFLRLSSHKEYYMLSWERLRGALIRWGYPPSINTKPRIFWEDKTKYIKPKLKPIKRSRIHAYLFF